MNRLERIKKELPLIPRWTIYQIRHSAATRLRKEHGLDVARAILGHGKLDTTVIYAEQDATVAHCAMEKSG